MHACPERQRGVRVPQVVKPDLRKHGSPRTAGEVVAERLGVDGAARGVGHDKTFIRVGLADYEPLLSLSAAVPT